MSALASQTIPSPLPVRAPDKMTRILIVADNPAATKDVAVSLRRIGFDVQLCLFDGHTLTSTPVRAPDAVLCHLTDYVEQGSRIAKVMRRHYAPRQLPVIGALSRPTRDPDNRFDSMLFAPMHASQIANRVHAMIRLGRMEAEITRRLETLSEDFGRDIDLDDMSPDRRFRVLFIGRASPAFMVIVNALQDKGVDVVAAFTSFSAFDYLHDGPFDAVVMNALEQSEPALSISEAMRRNSQLYHVPTLFLTNEHFRDAALAYERGARDLIDIDAEPEEISGRILELANYHRIHEQLKSEMLSVVPTDYRDLSGHVFGAAFFTRHLDRLLKDAATTGEQVSLLALKPIAEGHGELSHDDMPAINVQAAEMIKDMVRMQDVVGWNGREFVLAFYATEKAEAKVIRDRLVKLGEDTVLRVLSGSASPVTLSFEHAIYTVQPEDTAAKALAILSEELDA